MEYHADDDCNLPLCKTNVVATEHTEHLDFSDNFLETMVNLLTFLFREDASSISSVD